MDSAATVDTCDECAKSNVGPCPHAASAATGHRYDLRPMTTPDPGREPAPEDFETGSEYHAAYEAWLARWQPWMRERKERGYA